MSENYWLADNEHLTVGKKKIGKGDKLPGDLSTDLLKMLKERGVIGAKPKSTAPENVKVVAEKKELRSKLKAAEIRSVQLQKILREKNFEIFELKKSKDPKFNAELKKLTSDKNMLREMITSLKKSNVKKQYRENLAKFLEGLK